MNTVATVHSLRLSPVVFLTRSWQPFAATSTPSEDKKVSGGMKPGFLVFRATLLHRTKATTAQYTNGLEVFPR